MIEHLKDGRRVYTISEAAALTDRKPGTIRRKLNRDGTEPADWINPREPVYYPEDLGLETRS